MEEGFYDEDGCWYEDKESLIMTGILDFCGCVGNEPVKLIIEILSHFNRQDDVPWKSWEDLVKDSFNGNEAAAYMGVTLLDNQGLLEHGCAIRSAWLTEKGKDTLGELFLLEIDND